MGLRNARALRLAAAAFVLGGCTGGAIIDADTRAAINGVTVTARSCPTCPAHTTVSARQSPDGNPGQDDGIFMFDPYAGGPVIFPEGDAMAAEYTFSMPGYRTLTYYFRPQLKQYEHGSGELRLGDWFVAYMSKGPDSDDDQLSDAFERWAQTDPYDPDTDDDGLPDGWEVLGHDWVDYRSYGANPRRKDLFVELDYQSYYADGRTHSAQLRSDVIKKIEQWYRNMNVDNPDGTRGIAIHLVHDSKLPKDYECGPFGDSELENPRFAGVFHYGQLCLAPNTSCSQRGVASGSDFYVIAKEVNTSPSDDQDEEQMFLWAMMTAHEIGHTFGLGHGGGDSILCKPNYPSLMNYVYARNFAGSAQTLRDTKLQFSPGKLAGYPLLERDLRERASFGGLPRSEIAFMSSFGFPLGAHGFALHATNAWVDWDRDGALESSAVASNLTARGYTTSCAGEVCASRDLGDDQTLLDYNDGALIAQYLARIDRTGGLSAAPPLLHKSAPSVTTCAF